MISEKPKKIIIERPPPFKPSMVISYLKLRRALGILGVALPLILVTRCIIAGEEPFIQASISNYYHTAMRDFFVGILCAIAVFLFSYTGYDSKDNIAGDLAGLFGLGIAFFPTSSTFIGKLHLVSAVLFFIVLAYFSLFLFTKGDANPTKQKLKRNRVYKTCGYIMLSCMILIILYIVLPARLAVYVSYYKPVFWLETLALWAFGLSWLTKGEFLLSDAQNGESV